MMCDANDDIDELIEYELTRDSSDLIEEEEEFQEEVVIDEHDMVQEEDYIEQEEHELLEGEDGEEHDETEEMGEDEEEAEDEDTKPIIMTEYEVLPIGHQLEVEHDEEDVEIDEAGDCIDEPIEYLIDETKPSNKELEMAAAAASGKKVAAAGSNNNKKNTSHQGPTRYLLFDELIATIVDYEAEHTPIVEFSLCTNNEADMALPVECGICPDVMDKVDLANHQKTHLVEGTNRYACIYCTETYKDPKYLAGHARRHMGIRPYVCELCKLYFSTKQDLRVHNQRRHQAKELICEVCGKTFSQNTMLKRHREATHEKKRRFQCPSCPKAYYKNFSLQEHIRGVHQGKRRMLVCPFCGMQCRDAHKMARHRKQYHLNQTHFECKICQEEFTDINYFDAHKRSIQCRNNTRRMLEQEAAASDTANESSVYEITIPFAKD